MLWTGLEAEDGRRVMPSSANEQHRARRDANPATAPHAAPKRTSDRTNGINVQCTQQRASSSNAAKGRALSHAPKARVDRNALSARSDAASKRPLSPAAVSTDSTVRMNVRQCQDVDTMEQEESASLGAPGTQEDDRAPLLAWAARTPGIPDSDDPEPEWDAGPHGSGGYG